MQNKDLYSYFLTVEGTDQERAAVHLQLNRFGILGDKLVESSEGPIFSHYEVDEYFGAVSEWDEEELNDTLHQIALAVPGATLTISGNNETDRITQFQKRFHGDLFQMTGSVTTMEPLREGGDIPYALRNDVTGAKQHQISVIANLAYDLYKQDWLESHTNDQSRLTNMSEYLAHVKECSEEGILCGSYDQFLSDKGFRGSIYACLEEFLDAEYLDQAYMVGLFKGNEALTKAYREDLAEQGIEVDASLCYEEQSKSVYMLCEEFEDDNCPRSFTVLAVSEDKEALQKLLAAKVEKDEYGFVAQNGIDTDNANHFCSNFENDGFVEYYILDEPVLSQEKALGLLQTKAFDTKFIYPDNFRECVLAAVADCAENHECGQVDCNKVADDLMPSKAFQSELKTGCSWWFNQKHLSEAAMGRAKNFAEAFLEDILDERPEYFSEIGAAPSFAPPENLKDILIDCIYDVAKTYHIPVTEPDARADKIMRSGEFRSYISEHFSDVPRIEPGGTGYLRAITFCTLHVKEDMEATFKKPGLNNLIKNAKSRIGEASRPGDEKEPSR